MDVSKNRGTPKWMVKIMENPIKIDDLGGFPIFLETPMYTSNLWRFQLYLHYCIFVLIFVEFFHAKWTSEKKGGSSSWSQRRQPWTFISSTCKGRRGFTKKNASYYLPFRDFFQLGSISKVIPSLWLAGTSWYREKPTFFFYGVRIYIYSIHIIYTFYS